MAAGETVLYYNPNENASISRLTGVLFRMKIRLRRVKTDEISEKVGYLAGLKGFEPERCEDKKEFPESAGESPAIMDEMMVICNLANGRLNELLAQLRRAGAPRIALKATVTPTNCRWTFYELYQEIKEEHEALHPENN